MPTTDPKLTLPLLGQVGLGNTVAVVGISYSDSFAEQNPGELFLGISVNSGTLTAKDAAGQPIAGSGSNSIGLDIGYADLTAVLNSLAYTAGVSSGSADIQFDIWNQAGLETTGDIPITVAASAGRTETWTGAVSTAWNMAGNWSGHAVPVNGDTVIVPGATPNSPVIANATLSGETISLAETGTIAPTVTFNNVTLDSVLETATSGTVRIGGRLTIGAHGTLAPERNGTLLVASSTGAAVPIVNDGTITAPSGSFLTFTNGGTVASNTVSVQNNSVISSNGGDINFDFSPPPFGSAPPETLLNAGSISIGNGGGFTLNGTLSGHGVAFVGAGALGLQSGNAFADGAQVTGFGQGDQIDLYGTAKGGPIGFSDGVLSAGTAAAIPLVGTYAVGNFESELIASNGSPQIIAYAPDGGPSGVVQPDIIAPASANVAQGSTLSLGDVLIKQLGTTSATLGLTAQSGTLFMNGAAGSGTHQLSLGPTPSDQIEADLATLRYVPAAGASADTVQIAVSPPAPVSTSREIAITITGGTSGGGGPALAVPASERVTAGGTVAVTGSYSDSFAQRNPGELFVGISDSSGTLSATDASGQVVAGSGTNGIALEAGFVDVKAILASLHYTAGTTVGTDTIQFDVWNQAGTETTGATGVTIGAGAALSLAAADFGVAGVGSARATLSTTGSGGSITLSDVTGPVVHLPLSLSH